MPSEWEEKISSKVKKRFEKDRIRKNKIIEPTEKWWKEIETLAKKPNKNLLAICYRIQRTKIKDIKFSFFPTLSKKTICPVRV